MEQERREYIAKRRHYACPNVESLYIRDGKLYIETFDRGIIDLVFLTDEEALALYIQAAEESQD
jgi:hypothetical protein